MAVNELLRSSSLSWLAASGKDSDVVLSSRVRLARNFKEIPFPNRADFNQLAAVRLQAEKLLPGIAADLGQAFDLLDLERITPLQRDVLIEKQLISRNFIQNPQHRIAFITADRATSIMVNEEDHLRIQCMAPGLDLDTPFARASHIDDMVESQVDIAFDEKMGYLTSCPTNLGTGLRASVLLHLPGLVFTRNIQSIMNISPQLGLAIRSVYGDETESVGNLFQISNQLTLGFSRRRKCSSSCRRCASASTSSSSTRLRRTATQKSSSAAARAICKTSPRTRTYRKMKSTGCGPSMCAMPCSPTPGVRRLQNELSQSLHEPRHQGD